MASTLENLIAQLQGGDSYTPLTQEEIQKQAAQRYQSVYDQKRLTAQQTYENEDAALARELSGLQKNYDQQRASASAQTKAAYSQADRHALSRGMQRSSYNEANLANISLAGEKALQEIGRRQTEAEDGIADQRTELSQQLAQTLSKYDADQRNDELAYLDQLEAREYDRATASANTRNELAMKIYEYQHQLEQEAAEQARWQAEFKAKYGSGSSAKSSGGSSKKKTTAQEKTKTVSGGGTVRRNQTAMAV